MRLLTYKLDFLIEIDFLIDEIFFYRRFAKTSGKSFRKFAFILLVGILIQDVFGNFDAVIPAFFR